MKERASKTDIWTLTYDELFQRFEKFDPYVSRYTVPGPNANPLQSLVEIYEEPHFEDSLGNEAATGYLTDWKNARCPVCC